MRPHRLLNGTICSRVVAWPSRPHPLPRSRSLIFALLSYREACRLGCEGIVSKRLGSPYRSGRSAHWVKVKNPKARRQ